MTAVCLKILIMSMEACILILVVLLLRALIKRAPKWLMPAMWGIVGIKLAIPFSIPIDIFRTTPGSSAQSRFIYYATSTVKHESAYAYEHNYIINRLTVIWLAGVIIMLVYFIVSQLRMYFRLRTSVRLKDNIYMNEYAKNPFVFGVVRPKIYIPYDIKTEDLEMISAHENAHISRLDHISKPVAFIVLSVHWFNPLVWLAYILFGRDIEFACDAKAIKDMDIDGKADYAQTLLNFAEKPPARKIYNLTFGGKTVKKRIKAVLGGHPASAGLVAAAIAAVVILGVLCIISPINSQKRKPDDVTGETLIELADFSRQLDQNEYLCSIEGVEFKIQLYENGLAYEFFPETPNADKIMVINTFKAGVELKKRDFMPLRNNDPNYIKPKSMESVEFNHKMAPIVQQKALMNYLETISIG